MFSPSKATHPARLQGFSARPSRSCAVLVGAASGRHTDWPLPRGRFARCATWSYALLALVPALRRGLAERLSAIGHR